MGPYALLFLLFATAAVESSQVKEKPCLSLAFIRKHVEKDYGFKPAAQAQRSCGYVVLDSPTEDGLQVSVMVFNTQHRNTSISVVERVVIGLAANSSETIQTISLEQNRKIMVDGELLPLSSAVSSPQSGVTVSYTHYGTMATIAAYNLTVRFNGYTLSMETSYAGPILQGVCSTSGYGFDSTKDKTNSSSCAEKEVTRPDEMKCSVEVNQRCEIMSNPQGPFSGCHSHTDPRPYVDSCVYDVCSYSEDELLCSAMEAYSLACQVAGANLTDWKTHCACSDVRCADHEVCGLRNGQPLCLCNSDYSYNGTYGETLVCEGDSATLSLPRCVLNEAGIPFPTLHLKDPACTGKLVEESGMVTYRFDHDGHTCGTLLTANATHLMYKNAVQRQGNTSDVIRRYDDIYLGFSCAYAQPGTQSLALGAHVKDSSVKATVGGLWTYTLRLSASLDAQRTKALDGSSVILLDQRVYLALEASGLPPFLAVVMDSCWATPGRHPDGPLRWDIIHSGCASSADHTVSMEDNGRSSSTFFSFNMFKFVGEYSGIYLHCQTHLCVKKGDSCIPKCGKGHSNRRQRSLKTEEPVLISMAMSYTN